MGLFGFIQTLPDSYFELLASFRYDRSFSLLFDLERNDHFMYNLTLVSPRTNVSHAINFSTHSLELRTVQANMYLHSEQPQCDIRYIGKRDRMLVLFAAMMFLT